MLWGVWGLGCGSPFVGEAIAAARAVLPVPICVCSVFVCPNSGWDLCAGFLFFLFLYFMCAQLLMRVIA